MTAILFDTLKYTKEAEKVGIKREHAEFQASQLAKLVDNQLATKNDLDKLAKDIRSEMLQLELRLLMKLGTMMVISATLIIGILGFILKH